MPAAGSGRERVPPLSQNIPSRGMDLCRLCELIEKSWFGIRRAADTMNAPSLLRLTHELACCKHTASRGPGEACRASRPPSARTGTHGASRGDRHGPIRYLDRALPEGMHGAGRRRIEQLPLSPHSRTARHRAWRRTLPVGCRRQPLHRLCQRQWSGISRAQSRTSA